MFPRPEYLGHSHWKKWGVSVTLRFRRATDILFTTDESAELDYLRGMDHEFKLNWRKALRFEISQDCASASAKSPDVPSEGRFPWPGRERLTVRDRILIEARNTNELIHAVCSLPEHEATIGDISYMMLDWMWLHDAKFQEDCPEYSSYHSSFLRTSPDYAKQIAWKQPIPATDAALESWRSLAN